MNRRDLLKSISLGLVATAVAPNLLSAKTSGFVSSLAPSKDNPLLLNFNENSNGMSLKAKQAVMDAMSLGFRYPDAQRDELKEHISSYFYHGIKRSSVALGNGSSENIQAIVQALINKHKDVQLVFPTPTFDYAELYAKAQGVKAIGVDLKKDFSFDVDKMKSIAKNFNGMTIFYLCNPNNPTATILSNNILEDWIKSAPANQFFLIDEAYADFVVNPNFKSAIKFVKDGCENVAVTRTFSKLYGLAGFRVGYSISSEKNTKDFTDFLAIDNINLFGAVAALESMKDKAFIAHSKKANEISRKIVTDVLDKFGLKYAESNANFIFHEVKGNVKDYQAKMKEHHVYVGREFAPITNYNRLTLGTPDEMKAFVKVFNEVMK